MSPAILPLGLAPCQRVCPANAAPAPAPPWSGRRSTPLLGPAPGSTSLDIGGGTGGFAVRVAELGHRVTVVDPSPDALAALARRAREDGRRRSPASRATSSDLLDAGRPGRRVDVVLCHGVLEVVDDPAAALATIREVLRPGGTLSPAGRPAARRRRRPRHGRPLRPGARAPRRPPDRDRAAGRTGRRFTADEVTALLADAGFEVASVHGVRVFADLVPGSLLDLEPGATAALRRARAGRRRAARVPPARHAAARPRQR